MMTNFLYLLLLLILGGAAFSIITGALKNGIGPTPTSQKVKQSLLKSLPNEFDGKIFELGSGWGTLAIPIAKKFQSHVVTGYECSPVPFYFSQLRLLLSPLQNLTFRKEDFFLIPLDKAGLIICYLFPEAMKKLKEKFKHELKPGTWVISHTFAIPGWKPERIIVVNDLYKTKIYIYKFLPS